MSTIDIIIAVLAVALVVFTVVYNMRKGNKCAYCKGCDGTHQACTCDGQKEEPETK